MYICNLSFKLDYFIQLAVFTHKNNILLYLIS